MTALPDQLPILTEERLHPEEFFNRAKDQANKVYKQLERHDVIEGVNALLKEFRLKCQNILEGCYEQYCMDKYMGQYNRLLPFARLVDAIILYGTRVTAVRSIKFKKTNNFSEHVVLILDGGAYWVKVPTSSLKRLMADSKEKEKTFAKAVKILKVSQRFFHHFAPPTVIFCFPGGCPDYMKLKLNSLGIHVETPFTRPLTDFYHLNQELSLEYNALLASNALNIPPRADPISQDSLNIAPSVVIAYASELSYGGTFTKQPLNEEAERDRIDPVKLFIEKTVEGKKIIMCKTALNTLWNVMQNVAGPTEFQRAKEFLQRVHIVDDAYCDVVMNLKESFHISALHKIIFATGVYHKVPTFSSHKHFANAAYHQGVILSSIFHENRSHGERFKVQSELEE